MEENQRLAKIIICVWERNWCVWRFADGIESKVKIVQWNIGTKLEKLFGAGKLEVPEISVGHNWKLVWAELCVFFMCPISLAILIFYFAFADDGVWGSLVFSIFAFAPKWEFVVCIFSPHEKNS